MNIPIWIISAAVVGAGGHPAGVLAVANGVAVAVAVALAVGVGVAGGLALSEAAGGDAVAAEVHAARTSPSTTTMSRPKAEDVGDPLSRRCWGRIARADGPITCRS
jgi:hypothetical protein